MKKIYKCLLFILLFIFFLIFNLTVNPLNLDEIWSYGFSYNIVNGLIPYKDFNMVITPFYSILMAIPMFINNNLLIFHIENSIIITLFIFITYKLIKEKVFLILPLLIFPLNITFPNYNFFILFLFILLIYLEKNNKNDLLIGVLLSIIFLSKQSVGIFLIPVSLYYIGKKKNLKRFIGFIIPNVLFIIYLLITNSYKEFIDLCILGLFDFGKNNSNFNIFFIFVVLLILLILYLVKKHKKVEYYYLLGFVSICIPIFDLYHFLIYLIACLVVFHMNDLLFIFKPKLVGICLFIGLAFVYITRSNINIKYYPNDLNLFEYRYISKKNINYTKKIIKYMNKYNNKVMFIGPSAYYYKLVNNNKINDLDLINTGNYGYNGSNKLLNRVKELDKDYVFFIDKDELGIGKQTDQSIYKYIIKNYKKIDEISNYAIYRR